MASVALNPAAQPGDEGFTIPSVEFSAMAATPNSRRPSTTAPSLGTSPKAKRRKHVAPASVSGGQRGFSPTELSTGILELNAKMEAQAASIAAANEAVDDHTNRLDTLWGLLVRLDKTVGVITAEAQSNDKYIKQTVGGNDAKLKKDLCELETIATAHTSAIPDL